MKKKELKNIAKKIAVQELIIRSSEDKAEIRAAQEEIVRLSSCVNNIDDIVLVDEYVQDIIEKIS